MKFERKRLLALMMTAAMLPSSFGLSEEMLAEPEIAVEADAAALEMLTDVVPESNESDEEAPAERTGVPAMATVLYELAAAYGIEVEVLEAMLLEMGIDPFGELSPEEIEEIVAVLENMFIQKTANPTGNPNGMLVLYELAAAYGVEVEVLEAMLLEMGFDPSGELSPEEIEEIVAVLENMLSQKTANPTGNPTDILVLYELAAAYGIEVEVLEVMLLEMGFDLSGELSPEEIEEIVAMLENMLSRRTPAPTAEPVPTLTAEPTPESTPQSTETPVVTATPVPTAVPMVQPTEVLSNLITPQMLADQYGITVAQLAKLCQMSVSALNSLSQESLKELEAALEIMANEYDSVDEIAKDMGITIGEIAEAAGMTEQQIRSMTPIQVLALLADITVEPVYRFDDAYELADWYGMSLNDIAQKVGTTVTVITNMTPAELEELDAQLRAMGVRPNLSIRTAQQLADKYGMTVEALAKELEMSVAELKALSPEAITELDALLSAAGYTPIVEFATAQDLAEKYGLTLEQVAQRTGYTVEELLAMSPDRLKELDAILSGSQTPGETRFETVWDLAEWFGVDAFELAERAGIAFEKLQAMTPAELEELYEYLISSGIFVGAAGMIVENGVLVKYTGEERHVVIPDGVTAIGPNAFQATEVITVKIPDTVKSIGEAAFTNCWMLEEIYIPDSVTSIGRYAFRQCSSLRSARLPSGLTSIPEYIFNECSKLAQVAIPSGVTEIGASAFSSTRLSNVALPKGLKKIGQYAFAHCSQIRGIRLPEGLQSIGEYAFTHAGKLTQIVIPDSVTYLGDGVFTYSGLKSCVLPSGLKELPKDFFAQNYNLKSIDLPKGLQVVGSYAFGNCTSLVSVDLPKGVTRIEEGAFWGCHGLDYVYIPSSVKYMHDDAFAYCDWVVLLVPGTQYFIDYCNKNERRYYFNDRVSYIEYDPASITLMAGQKHDPVMYVDFEDADTITYTTSNKKVATVDSNGVITAKAGGTAKITAKSKKGGAKAVLTVTVKTAPKSLKLNQTAAEMAVGGTLTLTPVIPSNSATEYKWTSSNPSVAAVNAKGVVSAKTTGEATITVTTLNGLKASCRITVRTAPTALHLAEVMTLGVGQSYTLKPVIEPEYAFQGMSYVSSAPNVVQVSGGKLAAKTAGTAVITATTSNGISAQMVVTVLPAPAKLQLNVTKVTMGVGQSGKLNAVMTPASAYGGAEYTSSNPKVATVDSEGNVVALKAGSTTITAKTYNGKKATCKITVQKAPSSIQLSASALTLGVGEIRTLEATITKKTSASISWTSSDENVVVVDGGRVTPVGVGTATVTAATHNGKSASCTVTVKAAPTRIQPAAETMTLSVKQKAKLGVILFNGDSADCAGACSFSSSNPKILTVSASGEMTALKAGKVTVTVKSYVEGVAAQCEVTVVPLPSKVKLNHAKVTLGAGETLQLVPDLTPVNSVTGYTYTSSKSSVAKVDQNGLVTAVNPGSATITVKTHNGKKATCKITVKAAPSSLVLSAEEMILGVGQTEKISARIPDNSASGFKVTVSDESIISLSGSSVTAKAVGTAVITVETYNGLKKSCTVTVKPAPTDLVIAPATLTLSVGQSTRLDVKMLANGGSDCMGGLEYASSSAKVVTVDASGKITAKRAGTATVAVRTQNSGAYAECKVRVVAAPKKVVLNAASVKLSVGQTMQLIPQVSPANTPTEFTFTSSKSSVVRVNEDGMLIAVGKGSATITVKTHNGRKATCKITVA